MRETLENLGISEQTISEMEEICPNIKKLTADEIEQKIEILEELNCNKVQIRNIISSNAMYLDRSNTDLQKLIEKLTELGFDTLNILEAKNIINAYEIKDLKSETLIRNIEKNYKFLIEQGYTKEEVIKMTESLPSIISDISKENISYFHFTDKSNLEDSETGIGIRNGGLSSIPRNRPHTVSYDKESPTIYFVQGFSGILELMDVWIRYEYSELAIKEKYLPGYMSIDDNLMNRAYDVFYNKLQSAIYLKLELQAGDDPTTSDFNPEEEDFKKKRYFRKSIYHDEKAYDNELAKWNYGKNTNYEVATMERWNMNTHLKHKGEKIIPPDKVKIIQNSKGRTDALSVVREIYENYRDNVKNVEDLDKFIQYVIHKEKSITNDGYKDIYSDFSQKLGKETMQEQNDTQYINETTQEMEQQEKSMDKNKTHDD